MPSIALLRWISITGTLTREVVTSVWTHGPSGQGFVSWRRGFAEWHSEEAPPSGRGLLFIAGVPVIRRGRSPCGGDP